MVSAAEVKQYVRECGADLVGIGSMDRFEGAPKHADPRYIMPKARSIIGLGFRIHRGLFRGIEEGTFYAAYPSMGYANINDSYAPLVMRKVANFVEDEGYEAFMYANGSIRLGVGRGKPVSEDKPAPDVFMHFRIAGIICGLGEIGQSKLFLSPEFGPRQRMAFILTDMDLEPDPLVEPGSICDRCMQCVQECPAGALNGRDRMVSVEIGGKTYSWGKLDERKCTAVYQAGTREISPFLPDEVADTIDKVLDEDPEAQENMRSYSGSLWGYLKENVPYIKNCWESFHHPAALCGARGCIRACMVHLEEKGVLGNKFRSPFR